MRKTRFPGVYRLPDGRFRIRATAVCRRTGKLGERTRTLPHGVGEEDALRELLTLKDELRDGDGLTAPDVPASISVSDYGVQWLKAKAARVRPSTAREYERILADFILPRIGDLRFDALTRADIEQWVAWAERAKRHDGERYAKETVQGWWRVMCNMVRDAAAELQLPGDPTWRVKGPSPRVAPRREKRTLTAEALGRLLTKVRHFSPDRYAEVYVLAYTGMRAGELFALKWEDVDERRQRILVRRSVWHGYEDLTKTSEPREVALTTAMARVLREHRQHLLTGQHRGLASGLVFPSNVGTHRTPESLHKPLALAAEAAKIEVRVTAQVLRRTFNTLMVHAGVDRIVLRSQMGHSSEEMTRRYAGIAIEAKHAAVSRLVDLTGHEG